MAVNIDGNGLIALGGTSSTQGRLRLAEDTDNGTNYIELTAPASVGSDRVITFPDATTTVVGTDTTQTLTNKSIVATQLTGTIAAARLPAGSVLQVITGTLNTALGTTSTSFVDTGLSASITPSSASNKVLVLVYPATAYVLNVTDEAISFQVLRGATKITSATNHLFFSTNIYRRAALMLSVLDSPNTTSATTYKLQFLSRLGNNVEVNVNSDTATITLMEIAG